MTAQEIVNQSLRVLADRMPESLSVNAAYSKEFERSTANVNEALRVLAGFSPHAFRAQITKQLGPPSPAPLLIWREAHPAPTIFLNYISDAQR